MRVVTECLLLWLTVCGSGLRAQSAEASIEGRVVNGVTGAPVAGVQVILASQEQRPPARSDAEGRFLFHQLGKSLYMLVIDRDSGYQAREAIVDLRGGGKPAAIEMKAYRGGAISGRVQDARRRPVAGVTISIIRAGSSGGPIPPGWEGTAVTDDAGEYRFANLKPGSYRVLAGKHHFQIRPYLPKDEDKEPPAVEADVPTYYPNSIWAEGAGVVAVGLGQVVEAIDITLARERTVCAQSRVVDLAGTSTHPIDVRLHAQHKEGASVVTRGAVPRGEAFEVCGLGPGNYRLSAWPGGDVAEGRFAFQDFYVSSRRVRLPDLDLQPLVRVPGQLRIDGDGDKPPFAVAARVDLIRDAGGGCSRGEITRVRLSREGPFELALCPHGYWLDLRPPAGFYVKSASAGGVDLLRQKYQPAATTLEIVLGRGGPTLSVQVSDEKDRPVQGAAVLLGRDPMPVPFGRDDLRFAPTNSLGQAVLQGIAPGSYLVLAHMMPWDQSALSYPEFLLKHEADGERIRLSEGENRNLRMKVHDFEQQGVK